MSRKRNKKFVSERFPALSSEEEDILTWFRERSEAGLEAWDHAGLAELEQKLKSSMNVSLAVIEEIVSRPGPAAVHLLARMHNLFEDKSFRKAVKKALFRLKQKGVSSDEFQVQEKRPPVFREVEKKEAYGLVSAIDGSGSRFVLLVAPLKPRGWQIAGALVGDHSGMRDFFIHQLSRSGLNQFLKELRSEIPIELIRTEAGHCCMLFSECQAVMEERGEKLPDGYPELKTWIQAHCTPLERPVVYEFLDEEEIRNRPELQAQSESLMDIEPFKSWVIPQDDVRPYLEQIQEVRQSRIVLAPAQQAERIKEVYRKAVRELFTPEKRVIMKRRLEESAYLLLKEGMENQARIALATAMDLSEKESLLRENAFLLKMVTISINIWMPEDREKQETDQSSIIIP